jgi:hypothetical protein
LVVCFMSRASIDNEITIPFHESHFKISGTHTFTVLEDRNDHPQPT